MPVHRHGTDPVEKGKLEVNRNWQMLGIDITHYSACHFLMVTDFGPSHSSIGSNWLGRTRQVGFISWRRYSSSVAHRMKSSWTMTQSSSTKSFKLSHMSGEFTYDFVAHTHQPGMV